MPLLWTTLQDVDSVYHLAARVSLAQSMVFPRDYNKINVGGTVSLMEAIRDAGIRLVVLASSGGIYGKQRSGGNRHLCDIAKRGDKSRILANGRSWGLISPSNGITPTRCGGIHRPGTSQPMYVIEAKLALSVRPVFAVALTTVYRSTFAGLERYFCFFAALGTYSRKHLASGSIAVAITSVAFCLPGLAACGTALGLVGIAFSLEELLFLGTEGEVGSTVGAL